VDNVTVEHIDFIVMGQGCGSVFRHFGRPEEEDEVGEAPSIKRKRRMSETVEGMLAWIYGRYVYTQHVVCCSCPTRHHPPSSESSFRSENQPTHGSRRQVEFEEDMSHSLTHLLLHPPSALRDPVDEKALRKRDEIWAWFGGLEEITRAQVCCIMDENWIYCLRELYRTLGTGEGRLGLVDKPICPGPRSARGPPFAVFNVPPRDSDKALSAEVIRCDAELVGCVRLCDASKKLDGVFLCKSALLEEGRLRRLVEGVSEAAAFLAPPPRRARTGFFPEVAWFASKGYYTCVSEVSSVCV
jgi:hypothetical protein